MRYFWETIEWCVPPDRVLAALEDVGFEDVRRSVDVGVFSVYAGRKADATGNSREQGERT